MSQENMEIVRRAWEAFVRHDNEVALALYDPEIEIDVRHEARIGGGVYHGLEGVQRYFRDYLSVFGDVRSEVEEWIDAGDQIIAMVRSYGRGRAAGCPLTCSKPIFGPSVMESCNGFRRSQRKPKPSKPRASRSR
jgi:ketosteroid isomerase-like protein